MVVLLLLLKQVGRIERFDVFFFFSFSFYIAEHHDSIVFHGLSLSANVCASVSGLYSLAMTVLVLLFPLYVVCALLTVRSFRSLLFWMLFSSSSVAAAILL